MWFNRLLLPIGHVSILVIAIMSLDWPLQERHHAVWYRVFFLTLARQPTDSGDAFLATFLFRTVVFRLSSRVSVDQTHYSARVLTEIHSNVNLLY